jgi:endonuclease/exonuclease/phosphatase family metal-dependent hydrolase
MASRAAAASDVVLYSSDVTAVSGNWAPVPSASAAGTTKMQSADHGWAATEAPLANPVDFFEVTFSAPAHTTYHVWLRLRATGESKYNDSVWVQFSDALDRSGNAVYAIGSRQALLTNLTTCADCPPARWGWQDGAYWLQQETLVQFASSGTHRIRVQTREDGVQVDQIVLSPARYLSSAPGPLTSDGTILPHASSGDDPSAEPAVPNDAPTAVPAPAAPVETTAPAPASPQGGGGSSVAVAAWNIQVNDSSAAHARDVIARLTAMSPQPQVIAIEEAHQSQYNTYLDELRSRTGRAWDGVMLTHCAPGAWNGSTCSSPRDEGVAVFSSLPIVDASTKWLPYADAYHSARAAVRLAINVNGTTLQVFAVHLPVSNVSALFGAMGGLKAWAASYPAPQLAGGDFNADMDQIDTPAGMSSQFVDSWAQAGAGSGFTIPTPNPTMKLDYWFADASGRATVDWVYVNTSTGTTSDHFPIVASYTIH